jgi:hypothetical protein
MNRLRVFSLTTLMLILASRLPGQAPENWDGQVVVCNRGTISFSVAQAYKAVKPFIFSFSGYQWQFSGWYNVAPGKCEEIGTEKSYHNGGLFSGKDSVTLLAFAFYDSTGTWGAVRLSDPGNVVFHPSNQQFCVQRGVVAYNRDSPEGDLPRACDGAQKGYEMIPASFEYRGPVFPNHDNDHKNDFIVTLSPSNRAIPLGKQTSGGGAAPKTATPGGGLSAATVGTRNSTTAESGDADALRLKQYPACNVITRVEAEAVLGVSIDPPEPGRALCRYQEPGYGTDSSKRKQVTIGIWRSTAASPEDVNNRRNAIIKDKSLLPVSYKELPDFGDAALWVWAGGYYGALYAYRGGTVEVAVKISGVAENVALSTAKTFAARALGGVSKTGYVYAARKNQ